LNGNPRSSSKQKKMRREDRSARGREKNAGGEGGRGRIILVKEDG